MVDTRYTQDRELSWLRFDERVLEEARDEDVPLMERLKFAAIFTSNLDEFFMVRVGSLYDMTLVKEPHIDSRTGQTPEQQLQAIFKAAGPLYKQRDKVFDQLDLRLRQGAQAGGELVPGRGAAHPLPPGGGRPPPLPPPVQ